MTDPTTPFAKAMQRNDRDAIVAALAADVVLHSPVSNRPFHGREVVGPLLCAARDVLADLTYTHAMAGDGLHGLVFTARIGDRAAHGVDLVVVDDDGLVREFTAAIRPLSAATAFNEAMGPRAAAILGSG